MRTIIFILVLISQCLFLVPRSFAEIDKKYICPPSIEEALLKASIIPLKGKNKESLPLACSVVEVLDYNGLEAKIVDVYYGIFYGIDPAYLRIPAIILPNKESYLLPSGFNNSWEVAAFATRSAEVPFDTGFGWSNIQLNSFTNKSLIKEGNVYCVKYIFKFPFTGQLTQCPNPKAINDNGGAARYFVSGNVAYKAGLFQWKDALRKVLEECPKYQNSQCKCCIGGWDGEVPIGYWANGSTSIAMKISNDSEPRIESYIFNERIYRGQEENIFVQVFPDGRVTSRPTGNKIYRATELLKMAE